MLLVFTKETLEGYIRNEERCVFIRLEQWFMNPSMYYHHLEGLLQHRLLVPCPELLLQ